MGLLDQISSSLAASGKSVDYIAVIKWVEYNGGIAELLDKLRANGLSEAVESWLSANPNLPVSASQIQQAFGDESIAELAAKLNMSSNITTQIMAEFLPQIVDKLSPEGQTPDSIALLNVAMLLLKEKLFK